MCAGDRRSAQLLHIQVRQEQAGLRPLWRPVYQDYPGRKSRHCLTLVKTCSHYISKLSFCEIHLANCRVTLENKTVVDIAARSSDAPDESLWVNQLFASHFPGRMFKDDVIHKTGGTRRTSVQPKDKLSGLVELRWDEGVVWMQLNIAGCCKSRQFVCVHVSVCVTGGEGPVVDIWDTHWRERQAAHLVVLRWNPTSLPTSQSPSISLSVSLSS